MPAFGHLHGTAGPLLARGLGVQLRSRRLVSQPVGDTPPQPHGRMENIGIIRAYGKPVATLFLWSTLAYMSLQAVWSKLYFDEVRLETEARIDSLQSEVDALKGDRA
ncbi:hypothetical protein LPJ61_005101 [Coemansia biformis]|uniref:Uncharacterized protein n=1 Tax=Coemansia biformis TaxID=1286918 RepID=A0A9W8CWL6_9FUNG|nr:hypothetical protein LPJ61_005101 [Coemansia biformis]